MYIARQNIEVLHKSHQKVISLSLFAPTEVVEYV